MGFNSGFKGLMDLTVGWWGGVAGDLRQPFKKSWIFSGFCFENTFS